MKCIKGHSLQVCRSNNGYYIGTLDDDGTPICRLSLEYFKTRNIAWEALKNNSFTVRNAVEIVFCGCSYLKATKEKV